MAAMRRWWRRCPQGLPRDIQRCSDEVDKQGFEMRSLNLDQLRTLATVASLGSFSAAARELNLTPPAVSLQSRELEQRLGVRLIDRQGNSARATAAGQDLIAHADRLL